MWALGCCHRSSKHVKWKEANSKIPEWDIAVGSSAVATGWMNEYGWHSSWQAG